MKRVTKVAATIPQVVQKTNIQIPPMKPHPGPSPIKPPPLPPKIKIPTASFSTGSGKDREELHEPPSTPDSHEEAPSSLTTSASSTPPAVVSNPLRSEESTVSTGAAEVAQAHAAIVDNMRAKLENTASHASGSPNPGPSPVPGVAKPNSLKNTR